MITRIVKLIVAQDKVGDFMNAYRSANSKISAFSGCKYLELLASKDEPGIIFTYSHWETESDLENYLNSDFFKSTWTNVKPFFAGKPEAWSLHRKDSFI